MHLDVLVARASGNAPAPFWEGWSRLQKEYDRRPPGLTPQHDANATSIATNRRLAMTQAMKTHVVSAQEWEAARAQMLVKEKANTRARDRAGRRRRRMPWMAVEKTYAFEGPGGKASLIDLFHGRRQFDRLPRLLRARVHGWPEQACRGCSMVADQVAHVAHLNARDTTLAFVSRAPQPDITRLKARMEWRCPGTTITDGFDKDSASTNGTAPTCSSATAAKVFRTYFINNRGDEQMGGTWKLPRHHGRSAARRSGRISPEGYPQTPTYKWWNWHDSYVADAAPDKKWVEVSDAGEAAFRKQAG